MLAIQRKSRFPVIKRGNTELAFRAVAVLTGADRPGRGELPLMHVAVASSATVAKAGELHGFFFGWAEMAVIALHVSVAAGQRHLG